jgi:hypothetical protein
VRPLWQKVEQTHHSTIPAVRIGIRSISLNDSGVAGLKVFSSWWLNLDDGFIETRCTSAVERCFSVDIAHSG